MKKFNRVLIVALAVLATMSLVACGGNKETIDDKSSSVPSSAVSETSSEEVSEASSEEVSEASSEEASNTSEETYDYGGVEVKVWADFSAMLESEDVVAQEAQQYVEEKYNVKLVKAEMEGYDGGNDDELLIASIASGDPAADIMGINPENMVNCAVNDVLFDFTDYLDELQVGSAFTDMGTINGKVYGVGAGAPTPWIICYDRDYLKEIGVEKTPTEMFLDGKWDYDSFKAYLVEMKSKLPDGKYPIGFYPFHWGVAAANANGVKLIDQNGKLNYKNDAVIEATTFYQELINEGLACPPTIGVDEEGNTTYDFPYQYDDERIVMARVEPWFINGLDSNFGVVFWPWGSNVTCEGDYTTISDNYAVASPYFGFDAVVKSTKTGIPNKTVNRKNLDFWKEYKGTDFLHQAYLDEQAGKPEEDIVIYPDMGTARSFRTEEDLNMFDWGYTKTKIDMAWPFNSADYIKCWEPFRKIYGENLDTRSTLESYHNEGVKNLEDAGFKQD